MNKKKIIALIVSLVFVVALSISSVSAYLTATTDTIENTFTATTTLIDGDKFTLTETANYTMGLEGFELTGAERTNSGVQYNGVMPDMKIAKDPQIDIKVTTAAHLFLKVEAVNMTAAADYTVEDGVVTGGDLYSWTIAPGWELVETVTEGNKTTYLYVLKNFSGVDIGGNFVDSTIGILSDNTVYVANYGTEGATLATQQATLKFSAYAIQAFKVDVSTEANALDVFQNNFDSTFAAVAP